MATTGHRLKSLNATPKVELALRRIAVAALLIEAPSKLYTGVALGWDMTIAREAIEMGIPHVAAVPFAKQHELWSPEQKKEYSWILDRSDIAYPNGHVSHYEKSFMLQRNVWMVDNAVGIFAFYNYKIVSGTAQCVKYARSKGKSVNNYWELWQRVSL